MTFPPEIWLEILWHLAIMSYGTSLHPLLFVSRHMHDLSITLMYERISKLPRKSTKNTHKVSPTWVELLAARPNDRLQLTKELTLNFRSDSVDSYACDRAASTVISAMPNLRKLRIHSWFPILTWFKSFHPTATLTHLSCSMSIDLQMFRALLISQPSIEVLAIATGLCARLNLPSDALPHLQTFVGDSELWDDLLKGRSVEHLSGRIAHKPTFQAPQAIFDRVRTLSIKCNNESAFRVIAPFLRSIECMSVKVTWRYHSISPEAITIIPSTKLRYFSLGGCGILYEDSPHSVFEKFPTLQVVDHTKESNMALPTKATRYIRDCSSPTTIRYPKLQPWEPWWAVYPMELDAR